MFLQSRIIDSHSLPQRKWFINYRPTQSGAEPTTATATAGAKEETENRTTDRLPPHIWKFGFAGPTYDSIQQIPTAMSLWTDQLEAIHAASQLRLNDPVRVFRFHGATLAVCYAPIAAVGNDSAGVCGFFE
jgi:hypothetical protein